MPNYSFLKTDIINTIENNSAEFEEHIPYFVEKAEGQELSKDVGASIEAMKKDFYQLFEMKL